MYSGKRKFVNPLELSVFLHEFDQIFIVVLIIDKQKLMNKHTKNIYFFIYLAYWAKWSNIQLLSEKVCEPLHSVTVGISLSSKDLNQTFPVTAYQSRTSVMRHFGLWAAKQHENIFPPPGIVFGMGLSGGWDEVLVCLVFTKYNVSHLSQKVPL